MTTTTKLIIGAALAGVGFIAWKRHQASQGASATGPISTLRNIIDSGKAALTATAQTAAQPVELAPGGTPYGTVATTDTRKALYDRSTIPAQEVHRTAAQNALLGIY